MQGIIDKRIFQLTRGARRWIVVTFFAGLLGTAANIALLVMVGGIIIGIYEGKTLVYMVPYVFGMLLAMGIRAAAEWVKDVSAQCTVGIIKVALRKRIYNHILKLGPGYLEHKRTGALVATVVDGIEALEAYFGLYLPYAALCVLVPTLLFVGFVAYVDLLPTLILIAFVPLVPLAIIVFNRLAWKFGKKQWDAYRELSAYYADSLQGLTTLKLFNQTEARADEIYNRARELQRAIIRNLQFWIGVSFFTACVPVLGYALALIVASFRMAAGMLTVEAVIMVLLLGSLFYEHVSKLGMYCHLSITGRLAANSIFELLDTEPAVPDSAQTSPQAIEPHIQFEKVYFAYDSGERPALHGVSFEVRPGETVALVGATGAGKSTVIDLLYRFYDPQQGMITLGGRCPLQDLPLGFLRKQMALVAQDTYLFYGSVADNLRLGKPDATADELVSAARVASAHDFIQSLPEGYDTVIGERGVRLSGGERQRIAIARAVLKDAPILLLDEPTSNVDAENEAIIQKALDRLLEGRTVFVIAHRLSTVKNADRIMVMEHGRIVEAGTHKQLLDKQGVYANLIAAQRYEEEKKP